MLSAMLIVYRTPVYRIKLFEMSAMWLPTLGTPLAPSPAAILRGCRQTKCCATMQPQSRAYRTQHVPSRSDKACWL